VAAWAGMATSAVVVKERASRLARTGLNNMLFSARTLMKPGPGCSLALHSHGSRRDSWFAIYHLI